MRFFSDVWSENAALLKRFMKIHSNEDFQDLWKFIQYGFKGENETYEDCEDSKHLKDWLKCYVKKQSFMHVMKRWVKTFWQLTEFTPQSVQKIDENVLTVCDIFHDELKLWNGE